MTLLSPDQSALADAAAATLGGVVAAAAGADVDEAFDAAVAAAYDSPVVGPSLTAADPGRIQVVAEGLSVDEAIGAALAWLRENPETDAVAAVSVIGRSAHARRTTRARLEGVDLVVDTSAASTWTAPDPTVAEALVAADAAAADGEVLERFSFVRRARYKPLVEVNRGKSEGQFVVVEGDLIVSRGHRTAGDARRAAVASLKELAKDDHSTPTFEVYKLGGREGGLPLVSVVRSRVAQVLSVKAVYASLKPSPRAPKVTGWVFACRPGTEEPTS